MIAGRRHGGLGGAGSDADHGGGGTPGKRTMTQRLPVQRKATTGPGGDAPDSQQTSTVDPDEHVVLLSASTTDSGVGKDRKLFEPRKRYTFPLGLMGLYRLGPASQGGFADAIGGAAEWNDTDYFDAGGPALEGGPGRYTAVSTTFAITAHRDDADRWVDDGEVTIQAANNGMLDTARLVSAFISASAGGALATDKRKLRLLCTITMGNDVGGADDDARHERYLSTAPPDLAPQADFSAQAVMAALLAAWGQGAKVPWVRLWVAERGLSPTAKAADYAAEAERCISERWNFHAADQLVGVGSPLTGIAAAIEREASNHGPITVVPYGEVNKFDTYDHGLYADVSSAALVVDAIVAAKVKAAQTAWFADQLPPALAGMRGPMLADWQAAVDRAFAASTVLAADQQHQEVRHDLYTQTFMSANQPHASDQDGGDVKDGKGGSAEGDIVNPLRVHDRDRERVHR